MYKILKNIIEMDDYSVQKLSNQPPEPFEWNTVEGTELNVSDCIGGKGKIEVKRNTYQKQLSGKNLLDFSKWTSKKVNGVRWTNNGDGTVTANGTATDNSDFYVIKDYSTKYTGDYTISGCPSGGSATTYYVLQDIGNKSDFGNGVTKSFNNESFAVRLRIMKGYTANGILFRPMIELGTTKTDFEPYCGGQASPNPLYPQNIEVVTGDNVVKHVGKNLFDKDSQNLKQKYILNDNGEEISSNISQYSQGYTEVKPNTTYTLQGSLTHQNNNMRIYFYDENKNWISRSFPIDLIHIPYTFTTDSNIHFIRFQTVIDAYDSDTIQLEQGSTATQYEPYRGEDYNLNLGSIELCKIGDYEDIPFKNEVGDENYNAELEDGAWYKKGEIDKIAGSDNFATNGIDTNKIDFLTPVLNVKGNLQANTFSQMCCCNLLQTVMTNYTGINGTTSSKKIRIAVSKEYASTYDEAKQLLADIVIYYIQETPTYEKITDPTLISQLEALRKAKWFKGVNHWWTETDNLEPNLKGTYRQAINE